MAADATQYLLPDGIGLDAALERLTSRWALAVGPVTPFDRTFYDTFDGRLHSAGLTLIADGEQLVAARGPSYDPVAWAAVAAGERLFAQDLPAGPLRALVAPIVDVRALTPVARVRGRAVRAGVLNDDEKTVVRLVLEALEGGLRSRLHVVGVRGYDRALQRVLRALDGKLGLSAGGAPAHDEAIVAGGGVAGGVRAKLDVALVGADPAAAGAAAALGGMLRTIELNLPGTVGDVDSEFLHDLRVAVRRTRSVQRQLAGVFPGARWRWFRDEFRWLGQLTGPTRDLDVLLIDFEQMRAELPPERAGELAPLGGLLHRRREAARAAMVAGLESDRTRVLLAEWAAFLAAAPPQGGGAGSLSAVVGGRIRAVYRAMRRAGAAVDEATPAEHLHDLRKQGKELRYLLEIFAGIFPAEVVRPTVRSLKGLQETLGRFQDREVQATTLRGLGAELAAADGGPAALLALGVVLERVQADGVAARAEFAERFAVFAAADQRRLIRDGFR